MRRKLSIILGALALLLLLTGGLLLAYLSQLDANDLRGPIAAAITRATGFDLEISGQLELDLGFDSALTANDIVVRNPSPSWTEPLARADRLELQINLWKLLLVGPYEVRLAKLRGVRVNLQVDEAGAANWRGAAPVEYEAQLQADTGRGLDLLRAEADDIAISYRDAGSGGSLEGSIDRARVVANVEENLLELSAVGQIRGARISLRAQLERHLLARSSAGERSRIEATASLDEGQLSIVGSSGGEAMSRGLDLKIEGRLETLGPVARWLELPTRLDGEQVGPARLKARLLSTSGVLRLEDLDIEVGGPDTDRLSLQGSVSDLLEQPTADLQWQAVVTDLDDLLERSELPTWGVAAARASAHLNHAGGIWKAEELSARLEHRGGTVAELRGALVVAGADREGDLDVELKASRVGELLQIFEPLLPELAEDQEVAAWRRAWMSPLLRSIGPVDAKGHLAGTLESASLSRLELVAGVPDGPGGESIRATGDVRELMSGRGVELDLELGTANLQALLGRMGERALALREAKGSGHLSDATGALSLRDVALDAGRGDGLSLSARGELPGLDLDRLTDWKLVLHAREQADLERLLDRPMRDWGAPIDLSVTLDVIAKSRVEARDFVLQLDQSRITGTASAILDREPRPLIEVRLGAPSLRLRDLGVKPRSDAAEPSEDAGLRAGLDETIPFDALARFDADVKLAVDEVTGREGLRVSGARLHARLHDGVLEDDGLQLRWEGGEISASMRIDASSRPVRQAVRLRMRGADLAQVLAQLTREKIAEGTLEISADLRSSGETRRVIVAGLQGDLFLHAYDGQVRTKYSKALQFDVLDQINPNLEVPEAEALDCFVADFAVDSGRMKVSTMLLDTFYTQVLTAGAIDLSSGKLALVLTPVFKQNTRGSIAAVVNVRGTLSEPTVVVEPFATASAATRAAVTQTLHGIDRLLPRVAKTFDGVLRVTGKAGENSIGVGDFWTPGEDVSCELVLAQERILRAQALEVELVGGGQDGGP